MLIFTSSAVFAHPGHDHESWTSNFVHILFYCSLAAGAVCIGFAAYKLIIRNASKVKAWIPTQLYVLTRLLKM